MRLSTTLVRGSVSLVLAGVALGAGAMPAAHAGAGVPPDDVTRALWNTNGVQTYENGQLSALPVPNPPAGVNLQFLTIQKDAKSYTASLSFAGPYSPVGPEQLTFVSLQPPDGPRERISIDGTGATAFWKAQGDLFQPVPGVLPKVVVDAEGVHFSLDAAQLFPGDPAALDWGIQGHLLAPQKQTGFHAHTAQTTIGALTGEGPITPLAGVGAVIDKGLLMLFRPAVPMPDPMRFVSLAAGTNGLVDLTLAAPPVSLIGQSVGTPPFTPTVQQFGINVVRSIDDAGAAYTAAWNPAGSSDGVTVDGNVVHFKLPALGGAASIPDVTAMKAQATAIPISPLSKGGGCPAGLQTFDFTITINDKMLQFTHGDGDVASGPIDPASGDAQLTSPGGRTYDVTLGGPAIFGTHDFQGCHYDFNGFPESLLEIDIPIPQDPWIEPFGQLLDNNTGTGLSVRGPRIRLSSLLTQLNQGGGNTPTTDAVPPSSEAPPSSVVESSPPVSDRVQQPPLPPGEVFKPKTKGGGGNGLLIGGLLGGAGLLALGGLGAVRMKKVRFKPPKPKTRTDPVTGMVWICNDAGRPVRPAFWIERKDGTWGPPIGQELKMTARAEQIYQAHAEMHAATTISENVDDIEDPVRWFIARTAYDLLDAFSLGTLEKVERQENLGTAEGVLDSSITGLWAVGDLFTLGISGRIKENMEANAEQINQFLDVLNDDNASWDLKADAILGITNHMLDGIEEGGKQALIDLTPRDEINVLRNPDATTEQKTKAALTAVSKVAALIAVALGVRAGVKGKGKGPKGRTPPRGPRNPELSKGGVRPALEPGGGKNPELNKGGVRPALEPEGGKNPELNKGGVRPALEPDAAGPSPDKTLGYEPGELDKHGVTDRAPEATGGGMNDVPLEDVPISDGQEPGTRLPGELDYEVDPDYMNDPKDPGLNPATQEPLRDGVNPNDSANWSDQPPVTDWDGRQAMTPDQEAKALEVRAIDYEKAQQRPLTPDEQAHYDGVRDVDIGDLRSRPPWWWDAIEDPQTRAYLEHLRDNPF
jgi:hypothetical protein